MTKRSDSWQADWLSWLEETYQGKSKRTVKQAVQHIHVSRCGLRV